MKTLPLLLSVLALSSYAQAQAQVTLTAVESDSISPTGQNWNDNRFRAYWNSSTDFVDGFVRFDTSAIPDSATITGMTLRVYHEALFGSPANGPSVICYRVDNDTWSRSNTSDPHPGLGAALTPNMSVFQTGSMAANDFVINTGAVSWSADLLDDAISLALRNDNGNLGIYSYVYFHGADASPAPPELIVDYTAGPAVAVLSGAPGGSMTFEFTSFSPGGTIAAVYGTTGSYSVTGATCNGLAIGLSPLAGPVFLPANGTGSHVTSRPVGAGAAGLHVQAVDVLTCTGSNVLTL